MNRSILLLCCLLVTTSLVFAQTEDVLRPQGKPGGYKSLGKRSSVIGIEGGINMGFLSQSITPVNPDFPIAKSPEHVLNSGFGIAPSIGLFTDIPLTGTIGIQARFGYQGRTVSNTKSDAIAEASITQNEGLINGSLFTEATVESYYKLVYSSVSVSLLGRFDITKQLFVSFGPVVEWRVSNAERSDRVTVLSPDEVNFTVNYLGESVREKTITRTDTIQQSILPQASYTEASSYAASRVALEFGIGYRYQISKGIYVAPNVRYQYFLTKLTTGFSPLDGSRLFTQGSTQIDFDKASLNHLAIILQLGFEI